MSNTPNDPEKTLQEVVAFILGNEAYQPIAEKIITPPKPAEPKPFDLSPRMLSVLPRLSLYRVEQLKKAQTLFASEQALFWNATQRLKQFKSELEKLAQERGIPLQDVITQMKPGGLFSEQRLAFDEMVLEYPEAAARRKVLDKAMRSYFTQYERASEELLNPEQAKVKHFLDLKSKAVETHLNMTHVVKTMPSLVFEHEPFTLSYWERFSGTCNEIDARMDEARTEMYGMSSKGGRLSQDDAPEP